MHAGETKIQAIIDSTRQYVIPLFQRPYSWESPQWNTLWQDLAELSHVVFILVPEGFVTVPVALMREYIAEAGFTPKSDRTVRHYHVLISTDANPEFFHHGKTNRIPLKTYHTKFET